MQMSLFTPAVTWQAPDPSSWPDFTKAKVIGLDVETRDPNLKEKGPGAARGDGDLVGVSMAADGIGKVYIPLRHKGGGNVDPGKAQSYLHAMLSADNTKVGANLTYDLEWLAYDGYDVRGRKYCIQTREALINENRRSFSLENISKDRLGRGKDEGLLVDAAKSMGVDPKAGLWMMPAGYVGPYAEEDAQLALEIYSAQEQLIHDNGLSEVNDLESKMLDVLVAMRFQGIRVDVSRAEQLREQIINEEKQLLDQMTVRFGVAVDVWSGDSLAKLYRSQGIGFPTTMLGNPSFTADWLESQQDEVSQSVLRLRKIGKARGTFLENMILDLVDPKGLIHPQFKSVKRDDGGTKTGRLACSDPNVQQVPARDEEIGPLIRSLFIPYEKGQKWLSADYSAQEPRLTAHYAILANVVGADELRQKYAENPRVDYHQMLADKTGLPRKVAKVLNLSLAYGGGITTIGNQLGVDVERAKEILNQYHRGAPFVKALAERVQSAASARGYIVALGGRRCHFDSWEPVGMKYGEREFSLPLKEAEAKWVGKPLRRAFLHKALNRLIQSSAATQTKMSMVQLYYEHKKVSHASVHDELCFSVSNQEEVDKIVEVMEHSVKLEVPSIVDAAVEDNWGLCK